MKKLDFILIALVIIISGALIATYYTNHRIDPNNLIVEFEYKNLSIGELNLDDNDYLIKIYSNSELTQVTLDIFSGDKLISSTTTLTTVTKEVDYVVTITHKQIVVTKALCPHKYCLRMQLNKNVTTPIICTDGLTICFKSNLDISIIA